MGSRRLVVWAQHIEQRVTRYRRIPTKDFALIGQVIDIDVIVVRNGELPGACWKQIGSAPGMAIKAGAGDALIGAAGIGVELENPAVVAWGSPRVLAFRRIGHANPPVIDD